MLLEVTQAEKILLKELMINLITHDENQRMDWNEFFQHAYIQHCIHLKNVSL